MAKANQATPPSVADQQAATTTAIDPETAFREVQARLDVTETAGLGLVSSLIVAVMVGNHLSNLPARERPSLADLWKRCEDMLRRDLKKGRSQLYLYLSQAKKSYQRIVTTKKFGGIVTTIAATNDPARAVDALSGWFRDEHGVTTMDQLRAKLSPRNKASNRPKPSDSERVANSIGRLVELEEKGELDDGAIYAGLSQSGLDPVKAIQALAGGITKPEQFDLLLAWLSEQAEALEAKVAEAAKAAEAAGITPAVAASAKAVRKGKDATAH